MINPKSTKRKTDNKIYINVTSKLYDIENSKTRGQTAYNQVRCLIRISAVWKCNYFYSVLNTAELQSFNGKLGPRKDVPDWGSLSQ